MGLKQSDKERETSSQTELFAAYVRQDYFEMKIQKKLYSSNTLLAELIGLYKFMHLIFLLLTYGFREASFMNTILSRLFMKRLKSSNE
jgi:hypothetical protein